MPGILVYAEQKDGVLKKASMEVLGEGLRLAGALGVPLCAFTTGPGAPAAASAAAARGATKKQGRKQSAVTTDAIPVRPPIRMPAMLST